MSEPIAYDPFQDGFSADPYPHLAELRREAPVHESELGMWFVFGYDDIFAMLRDPSLSVENRNAVPTPMMQLLAEAAGGAPERGDTSMLNRDPPDHTRLRRLVSKAFTPRTIEQLRPRIEELVDSALDAASPEWNVIDELAFPLPFQVISELLGTPSTDTAQLREWSGLVVRSLEPVFDPEVLRAIAEAGENLMGLISEIITWKKANPADDMLTALIAAEEDGDTLTETELTDQVALLYIAGHETTVNLIGNGTLALLRHRDQMDRLRSEPELAAGAIDELLRYDSPVQSTRRINTEPVTVGEREIGAGSFIILALSSANRDENKWGPTADTVDITRERASQHVSFGGGHHFCLGSHLARLEAQVAITRMIGRFPDLDLAGEPQWNGRINLRGLSNLPVTTG